MSEQNGTAQPRRRGRPRKSDLSQLPAAASPIGEPEPAIKRGPGRPRKTPLVSAPAAAILFADLPQLMSCSKGTAETMSQSDPDFPRVFWLGSRRAVLRADWDAYMLKLRDRSYVAQNIEPMRAKRRANLAKAHAATARRDAAAKLQREAEIA